MFHKWNTLNMKQREIYSKQNRRDTTAERNVNRRLISVRWKTKWTARCNTSLPHARAIVDAITNDNNYYIDVSTDTWHIEQCTNNALQCFYSRNADCKYYWNFFCFFLFLILLQSGCVFRKLCNFFNYILCIFNTFLCMHLTVGNIKLTLMYISPLWD